MLDARVAFSGIECDETYKHQFKVFVGWVEQIMSERAKGTE